MIDFPNIKDITAILASAAISDSKEDLVQVPRSALWQFLLYSTMLKNKVESNAIEENENQLCISDLIIVSDTIITK